VAYTALNKAWRENRCFALVITNDDGTLHEYDLRVTTAEACIQLFRSVTESHSFFGCETVNSTVRNQYTRDFKDSIISFFSEETSEKLYTFDVDKTVIEVHDHIRRVLYREQQNSSDFEEIPSTTDCETNSTECGQNVGELRQKLDNIQQAFICKICMDAKIDTVLIPCGHWVCCSVCGSNIDKCPLCRTDITLHQRVYMDLPGIFDAKARDDADSQEEMNIDASHSR
jgi:E3 ubiquitin-protein ligase MYLIP